MAKSAEGRSKRGNYKIALAKLPVAFLRSDADGRIIIANSAAQKLLGGNLIGRGAHELYGNSNQESSMTPHDVKIALVEAPGNQLVNVTVPIKLADGSSQDMMCSFVWDKEMNTVDSIIVPNVIELHRSLERVAESLVKSHILDDTLSVITHEARLLCRAERSYVKLFDPTRNVLVFKALSSTNPHEKISEESSSVDRGMTGYVFRYQRPYRSGNAHKERSVLYYSIFKDTISKVVVPLLHQEQNGEQVCYGVLSIDGKEADQFGYDTVEILSTLARHASIAIAQVKHLYEVREDYDQLFREMRSAQYVRGVRNILHDGKNMVRLVVDEFEAIQDELIGTNFWKRRAKQLEHRLDSLKALNDLMQELLEQMKSVPSKKKISEQELTADLRSIALRAINVIPVTDTLIDIKLEAERQPYLVPGRPTQLLLAFYNLLVNAVTAIKRSNRPGKITITLSPTPKRPGFYRVQVDDNGPGLPRSILEFIRQGEGYSGVPGGTGLGLLTVRETVKSLKGHLDVDSKYGAGTRFIIDLPRSEEDQT
jgi:signal transduction histidine kinase